MMVVVRMMVMKRKSRTQLSNSNIGGVETEQEHQALNAMFP